MVISLKKQTKPQIQFFIACAAVIFLSIGSARYVLLSNYDQLLQNDAHIFDVRIKNLTSHVSLIKTNLLTLKTAITNNIALAKQKQLDFPMPKDISTAPNSTLFTTGDPIQTLLIYRSPDKRTPAFYNQLKASNALLPTLQQVLKNIPNSLWIFYVSKEGFSFLSPEIPRIPSEKYTYSSIFWTQTIPENNPDLDMVVTDAYEDYFSKELVITITIPVVFEDVFVGLIGFDLGINALLEISQQHQSVGQTFIFDDQHSLVHSNRNAFNTTNMPDFNGKRNPPKDRFHNAKNGYWNRTDIFGQELYAMHWIDTQNLLDESIKMSIRELAAITVTALVLILFLFRLRNYGNKITELSNSDPLTGLLNRRAMKEISGYQIAMCHRNNRPISLAILDIDHFKKINDQFGHDIGDQVLKLFAEKLESETRTNDLVCRYGGEEFIICLPELDKKSALDIILRFQGMDLKAGSSDRINITFSAGIAQINPGETLEAATKKADQALLYAKQQGRNRIEVCADSAQ